MLKGDELTEIIDFEPYDLFICQLVAWKKNLRHQGMGAVINLVSFCIYSISIYAWLFFLIIKSQILLCQNLWDQ